MKKITLIILGLLICVSCIEEKIESNPFLGTWHGHESSYDNGITVYSDILLTFFEDYTYSVEIELSTSYNASKTLLFTGKYEYNTEDKIWLNDNNGFFGDGSGYYKYSIYNDVLKLSATNESMIFRR